MRMYLLDEYVKLYKERNQTTLKASKDVYIRLSEIWLQLTENERSTINNTLFE